MPSSNDSFEDPLGPPAGGNEDGAVTGAYSSFGAFGTISTPLPDCISSCLPTPKSCCALVAAVLSSGCFVGAYYAPDDQKAAFLAVAVVFGLPTAIFACATLCDRIKSRQDGDEKATSEHAASEQAYGENSTIENGQLVKLV